ncbi:MAG: glucose-1-phosphate thymidylyltransferase RfbA [Flavobacteriaceae bacterium]
MKAILLAGGSGSRLYPLTKGLSKQLLPVYDKPMVYYPLSLLLQAGIREVLLISTPTDLPSFKRLLGKGSQWGLQLSYAEQAHPNGIAEAFIIGADFIGSDPVALILGDNLFYGADLDSKLQQAQGRAVTTATIFGCHVENPQRYGVIAFDQNGKALSIEEKPITPKSNYAVVGLYFYPNSVVEVAKQLAPSSRGELEITDVNQHYLDQGNLQVETLGQGHAWLDTGTHESLMEATQFIQTIEKRQGLKIGCLEEIAFKKGFISRQQLLQEAEEMKSTPYGQYLIHRYDS